MFKLAVFGIITNENDQILLCHRCDYDLWNLPGGGVEVGESPTDALIREVKEETGLDIIPYKLTGVYSKPDKNELVLSFTCKVVGGELALNDEADQIKYFSLDQIPHNSSVKQIERLKDYMADKNTTHYKVQTGPSSMEFLKEGTL
jgi:ADP-ribose pyrophosphatase YjhB (NUDIX family)